MIEHHIWSETCVYLNLSFFLKVFLNADFSLSIHVLFGDELGP